MQNKLLLLTATTAALFALPLFANAQMVGGMGMGAGMGEGMGIGTGMNAGGTGAGGQGSQSGFTSPEDMIKATAPPFGVEDVIRMHRVGLADVVIINALRSRYHPILLTRAKKARLESAGVDARVIYAIEDPFDIGLARVRAEIAKEDRVPPQPGATRMPKSRKPDAAHPVTRSASRVRTKPLSIAAPARPAEASVKPEAAPHRVSARTPHESSVSNGQRRLSFRGPLSAMSASRPHSSAVATLNLSHAPFTRVPPEPVAEDVTRPAGHGIFLRHGSRWQRVDQEAVYWQHRGRGYRGSILRPGSDTATYPGGTDFLIIAPAEDSALQYQLVRLKRNGPMRTFEPNPPGEVYSAGLGPDLVPFDPSRIGPSTWFVSLHDLEPGQYGFLPPSSSVPHSTTGLATTMYTFEVQ